MRQNSFSIEEINYSIRGEGAPLLLINGSYQSIPSWEPLIRDLEKSCKVICFDFPNQGKTFKDPAYNTFSSLCDFAEQFLETIKINPSEVTTFGLSMGAEIIRCLHVERQVPFKKMILGGISPPSLKNFKRQYVKTLMSTLRESGIDAFVKVLCFNVYSPVYFEKNPQALNFMIMRYRDYFGKNIESLAALICLPLTHEFNQTDVSDYRCPVVLVSGTHDNLVPIFYSREYAEQIGASLHYICSGHTFPLENPEETVALLKELVRDTAISSYDRNTWKAAA